MPGLWPGTLGGQITAPPTIFVAVSDGDYPTLSGTSVAASSLDGITWTQRTMPASAKWENVAYGNGTFVAIARESSIAATSTNGITWTQRAMPTSATWRCITFGNGVFVAMDSGTGKNVAVSSDGINWTSSTTTNAGWSDVIFATHLGIFVAIIIGSNTAATSNDGLNWTYRTLPTTSAWTGLAYGNNTIVAVSETGGSFGNAATSTDGINWTARQTRGLHRAVAFGNNIFSAVGSTVVTTRSTNNGVTWTEHGSANANNNTSIAYGSGVFVATCYNYGTCATSPDGISWTMRSMPGGSYKSWTNICNGVVLN